MKLFALNHFIIPASLIVLLAGCKDEITVVATFDGNTNILASNSNPKSLNDSRTVVFDDGDDATGIQIHWTSNDQIGVMGTAGTVNARFRSTLSSSEQSAEATFNGNLKSDEAVAFAYYPYSYNAAANYASTNDINGQIPPVQKFYSSSCEIDGDFKVCYPDNNAGSYEFEHVFSFLKFDIDASATDMADDHIKDIEVRIRRADKSAEDSEADVIPDVELAGNFIYHVDTRKAQMVATSATNTIKLEWPENPVMNEKLVGYMTVASADLSGMVMDIAVHGDKHYATLSIAPKITEFKANTYYTVPVKLSESQAYEWSINLNEGEQLIPGEAEQLYVKALDSQMACANWFFAVPGKPVMHKIRVDGQSSVSVSELPEGLYWSEERQLVYGNAPTKESDYYYLVSWSDGVKEIKEGVKFTVSSTLHQPTPHMGWQSWNVLEKNISDSSIREIADAMVNNGYTAAGYTWLGIDDCWQKDASSRDANGYAVIDDEKFPNGLKVVTDYIHSKGLKAGIYSDAGKITCEGMVASYNYEATDAKSYTEWGFDKLKEDWFWTGHGDNDGKLNPASTELAYELYKRMGDGIKAHGNKILLSMCEWGIHEPWKWGPEAGASSWRMSYDHRDGWLGTNNGSSKGFNANGDGVGIGLKNSIYLMRDLWPYAGVNRFNDPDMLVVGIRGTGRSSNDLVDGVTKKSNGTYVTGSLFNQKTYTGMSDAEYETEFAMWCMWSAPLLITADVRKTDLNTHDVALLKNANLIALNQDILGQQAEFIKADGNVWYFCKDLADGGCAIAAVNLGDSSANYTINRANYTALIFPLNGGTTNWTYTCLIGGGSNGTMTGTSSQISGSLDAHATIVYRFTNK